MFLTLFAFIMRFVDIPKLQENNHNNNNSNQLRCCLHCGNVNCNRTTCIWQHAAKQTSASNSSSTSSGCDSATSSSKENYSLTPQQLQQLRYQQHMQQQQLQVLQRQLQQRKILQQQLRAQGVQVSSKSNATKQQKQLRPATTTTKTDLTCNQQYLIEQKLLQRHYADNRNYTEIDILNNNNNNGDIVLQQQNHCSSNNNYKIINDNSYSNNNNNFSNNVDKNIAVLFIRGQRLRRGMTELSTNTDLNNKTHYSQPLQNSPRHSNNKNTHLHNTQNINHNSPLHHHHHKQHQQLACRQQHNHNNPLQQQNNQRNNEQTLLLNFKHGNQTPPSSATQSPLHSNQYRNPFNSPSNTPYAASAAVAYVPHNQQHHQQQQQHYLRQQTQYQQHLTDLLQQQQQLQKQQQQLLRPRDTDDADISEESLKQNVAIVLNNLERYNNALRSVILNEQVNNCNSISSVFSADYASEDSFLGNNNYNVWHCGGNNGNNGNNRNESENKMATAITPESDYNSNATTPGSRSNNMLPCDNNFQQQQQQNTLVGYNCGINGGGGVGGGVNNGLASNQNATGGCNSNTGYCHNNHATLSNNLNCSLASSHDFTHDNSDYQWFLDYGYRDGANGGMQRSVLSSLTASYNGFGDLVYYEDLAKNIDANLAEVDMESFRAEDIHSLLSQLPAYCKQLTSMADNDRFAQSLLVHQQQQLQHDMNQQLDQHDQQQQQQIDYQQHGMLPALATMSTTSSNGAIENSFCKSEILFSPVKESHISVDSLDLDAYPDDGDIILTCKANKDNYTIAFEGSMMYSDESFYEPNEIAFKNRQNYINLHSNLDDIVNNRKALDVSMSRSEQQFAPNNRQQQQQQQQQKCYTTQLARYPSGNNNTAANQTTIIVPRLQTKCTVRKSSSLPNLPDSQDLAAACGGAGVQIDQLNVSQVISTSTMEQCKLNNLLPMCQIPISASVSISERLSAMCHQRETEQQQQRHKHHRCSCGDSNNSATVATTPTNAIAEQSSHQQQQQQKPTNITGSTSSGNSNPPAYNLVKLFIKQKSNNCSSDDNQAISAHTCMDVSSGCWPSSDAAGSSSSSSLEQRLRKKSMHDSGKGSALSRHDEEELLAGEHNRQSDSEFTAEHSTPKKHLRARNSDAVFYDEDPSSSSTASLTATNSPAHRRRSMPLRHPQVCQLAMHSNAASSGGQSTDASHSTSEQLTQVYMASGGAAVERRKSRRSAERQAQPQELNSNASSSEMITRSMQTSCGSMSTTRSSLNDRLRCVPPSFLAKLNKLGEERQAPIYVIYPSYALPDLGFVQTNASPEVIFSPFNYKMTLGPNSVTGSTIKKRFSINGDGDGENNDDELLKTINSNHVVDWQSLATLLPPDYRRRLKHIPEVKSILPSLETELSHKPLFCLTPAVRRNRPHVCDCEKYLQQQTSRQQPTEGGSSSSGSSQQPSSGYRGSSTMLTDSELSNVADPLKQMYVYQYEQQQRIDSGVETKPQPMPRGILRKTHSQAAVGVSSKRNSMIENQQSKLSKFEKRRSLQEAPHNYAMSSAEELAEVFEEEELNTAERPRSERLSRRDMDARARAENFLSSLPRSELKYYAEIAAILESSEHHVEYDAAALKKEVSRVLSQQKKVSFNDGEQRTPAQLATEQLHKRFATPPNSPNISMATGRNAAPRRLATHIGSTLDEKEMRRIENNRFKRLQIQWEEMSKDTRMLKDLVTGASTKSGDTTPTALNAAVKSRIPRPVSYPAGKRTDKANCDTVTETQPPKTPRTPSNNKTNSIVSPRIARITQDGKVTTTTRSPSRIVPPKRYSMLGATPAGQTKAKVTSPATPTTPTGNSTATLNSSGGSSSARNRTPNGRVAVTAPNTPKRSVPRSATRVR